jgi:hypothetical protein
MRPALAAPLRILIHIPARPDRPRLASKRLSACRCWDCWLWEFTVQVDDIRFPRFPTNHPFSGAPASVVSRAQQHSGTRFQNPQRNDLTVTKRNHTPKQSSPAWLPAARHRPPTCSRAVSAGSLMDTAPVSVRPSRRPDSSPVTDRYFDGQLVYPKPGTL